MRMWACPSKTRVGLYAHTPRASPCGVTASIPHARGIPKCLASLVIVPQRGPFTFPSRISRICLMLSPVASATWVRLAFFKALRILLRRSAIGANIR